MPQEAVQRSLHCVPHKARHSGRDDKAGKGKPKTQVENQTWGTQTQDPGTHSVPGSPASYRNEKVQGLLPDRRVANGLDSVCPEGGGGIKLLPEARGRHLWSDVGGGSSRARNER